MSELLENRMELPSPLKYEFDAHYAKGSADMAAIAKEAREATKKHTHLNGRSKPFIAKYTPHYLRDFVSSNVENRQKSGTEYVLKTLMEMDDMNTLLVGGFNSGKTTMLYALIREYYGLAKDASISETNVLFINNLKEQGIQFFRNEMKTFCQTHCSIHGKKKVILIDDMDSINKQSQQVFRNYIDKYKAHVCVIASCANLQKVVESLQSRLHIVMIHPPAQRQLKTVLDNIVREEVILIDRGCHEYLLDRANGNVCNIVNNLEKLAIYGSDGVIISKDVCEKLCSTISFHQFEMYLEAALRGDIREAISIIYGLCDYGYSVIDILEYFFEFVKSTDRIDECLKYRIVPHICDYISVFHSLHENSVELAIFTNQIIKDLRSPEGRDRTY
jgi:DNA polymerase III delta prime subunit